MRIGPNAVICRHPNGQLVTLIGEAIRHTTATDLALGRQLAWWWAECDAYDLPPSATLTLCGLRVSRVERAGLWVIEAEGVGLHPEDGEVEEQLAALDVRAAG